VAKLTSKKSSKAKASGQPSRGKPAGSRLSRARAAAKVTGARRPGKLRNEARRSTTAPGAKKAQVKMRGAEAGRAPAGGVPNDGPVRAPARPVRNLAGLKAKDLELFRELLLAKRRDLLGDVFSMEEEALRAAGGTNLSSLPIHMADMGTDNYEQEFTLGLVQKDRELLAQINTALVKIRDGTYGICEGTGKPISKARLEAQPWARYSIEYARKLEKGLVRA
jgi:RNA polymerase-binding protein DksA